MAIKMAGTSSASESQSPLRLLTASHSDLSMVALQRGQRMEPLDIAGRHTSPPHDGQQAMGMGHLGLELKN
jgi:hypothetical protein